MTSITGFLNWSMRSRKFLPVAAQQDLLTEFPVSRDDKRKLAGLQTSLEQSDDKLLELFQPDLAEIRQSLSSTEALDEQNQRMAAYVSCLSRNSQKLNRPSIFP